MDHSPHGLSGWKRNAAVQAHGRPLAEAHLDACVRAGLTISGMNAEANPGQWEFQIGPGGPYEMPDHVMVARWLLHRIGEDMGVTVSMDPSPVSADGHGAAANTNFSTARMRRPGGMEHIEKAIVSLEKRHAVHMQEYGGGAQPRRGDSGNTSDVCPLKPLLFLFTTCIARLADLVRGYVGMPMRAGGGVPVGGGRPHRQRANPACRGHRRLRLPRGPSPVRRRRPVHGGTAAHRDLCITELNTNLFRHDHMLSQLHRIGLGQSGQVGDELHVTPKPNRQPHCQLCPRRTSRYKLRTTHLLRRVERCGPDDDVLPCHRRARKQPLFSAGNAHPLQGCDVANMPALTCGFADLVHRAQLRARDAPNHKQHYFPQARPRVLPPLGRFGRIRLCVGEQT